MDFPSAVNLFDKNKFLYLDLKNCIKDNFTFLGNLLGNKYEKLLNYFLEEYKNFEESKLKQQEFLKKKKLFQKKNCYEYKIDKSELIIICK